MTTAQKIAVTVTVAAAVIAVVYERHRAAQMESELQELREQQTSWTSQIEPLRRERDEMSKRMTVLVDENVALKDEMATLSRPHEEVAQSNAAQADALQSAAKSWLERVTQLKQRMDQTPGAKIPELQFLSEEDWLNAAKSKLETEEDYRRAMASLRFAGEDRFASIARPALREYSRANDGAFPTALSDLQPYFKQTVDNAILQRYEVVPSGEVRNLIMGGQWIITQKSLVDDEYDTTLGIGPNGYGTAGPDPVFLIVKAFATANGGQPPTDYTQLLPYATTPAQQRALQRVIQNLGTDTAFPRK